MRRLGNEVELAELTHHLITRQQLSHSELTPRQIRYAVASRRLHPVIDDVFSTLPGPFDFLTKAIALSLRYPEGYLSGPGAISYWGMRKGSPELLQFTVSDRTRPRTAGFAQFRYSNDLGDVSCELDGL